MSLLALLSRATVLAGAVAAASAQQQQNAAASLSVTFSSAFFPSDAAADDRFAFSIGVSADGSRGVVGAYAKGSTSPAGTYLANVGAAYVFSRNVTAAGTCVGWAQGASLLAPDVSAGDTFGSAVAISADGGYVAVGAPGKNGNQGAVLGYALSPLGVWTQVHRIDMTSTSGDAAFFGYEMSMTPDATTLVVGAYAAASSRPASGAAYVFTRAQDGGWMQTARLYASDSSTGDEFGSDVSINAAGTVIAVGAPSASSSGAVYVFTLVNGVWTQTQKLVANDAARGDNFGISVSLDAVGLRLAIGAYTKNVPSTIQAGVTYVFAVNTAGRFVQSTALTLNNPVYGDVFGYPVVMDPTGSYVYVGAFGRTAPGVGFHIGSVAVFARSTAAPSPAPSRQPASASNGGSGASWGWGWWAAASASGSPSATPSSSPAAGTAVTEWWPMLSELIPSRPQVGTKFGISIGVTTDGMCGSARQRGRVARTLLLGAADMAVTAKGQGVAFVATLAMPAAAPVPGALQVSALPAPSVSMSASRSVMVSPSPSASKSTPASPSTSVSATASVSVSAAGSEDAPSASPSASVAAASASSTSTYSAIAAPSQSKAVSASASMSAAASASVSMAASASSSPSVSSSTSMAASASSSVAASVSSTSSPSMIASSTSSVSGSAAASASSSVAASASSSVAASVSSTSSPSMSNSASASGSTSVVASPSSSVAASPSASPVSSATPSPSTLPSNSASPISSVGGANTGMLQGDATASPSASPAAGGMAGALAINAAANGGTSGTTYSPAVIGGIIGGVAAAVVAVTMFLVPWGRVLSHAYVPYQAANTGTVHTTTRNANGGVTSHTFPASAAHVNPLAQRALSPNMPPPQQDTEVGMTVVQSPLSGMTLPHAAADGPVQVTAQQPAELHVPRLPARNMPRVALNPLMVRA